MAVVVRRPATVAALPLVWNTLVKLAAGPNETTFAGCSAVHAGPACALPGDRTLRLWVKAPMAARVVIEVDAVLWLGT